MSVETQVSSLAPARSDVLAALRAASIKTGSDFDYLVGTAIRESRLDSQAKSKSSSATGLFQFIDQTWLGLVKRHGARHGLAEFASAISDSGNGHYAVSSQESRSAILALRKDAGLSALMAGEAAKETKQNLECALGREVCGGELYAAHFLGESAAKRLICLNSERPDCAAAAEFPGAARANRSIFYNADGTSKSVREVYEWAVELPDASDAKVAPRSVPSGERIASIASPSPLVRNSSAVNRDGKATSISEVGETVRARVVQPRSPTVKEPLLPQRPLLLSFGVIEILASLAPAGLVFSRRAAGS